MLKSMKIIVSSLSACNTVDTIEPNEKNNLMLQNVESAGTEKFTITAHMI